jgi:cysteine desulfurase
MTERMLYFDHNATTPLRPEAAAAMVHAWTVVGNPSSVHAFGRAARRIVEDAREQVAAVAAVPPAAVVFTSGGTEANVLALRGSGRRRVLVSAVEHVSVLGAVEAAEVIPVDGDGVVDLAALGDMLDEDGPPALVSVMLANNETGVIQPVAAVAELAARHGAVVHCDAVQAAGKVPLDPASLGAHMLSLSAHKLGGPSGVGALIVRDVALSPQAGGGQERRRRGGTENVAGIAGFGAAAAAIGDDAEIRERAARMAALQAKLESRLVAATPFIRIVAAGADRLANTTCVLTPGRSGENTVMALDLAGVAVSAGAACSSGKVSASHVLRAIGLGEHLARQAVRVSMGWTTTEQEVDEFVDVWRAAVARGGPARFAAGADVAGAAA